MAYQVCNKALRCTPNIVYTSLRASSFAGRTVRNYSGNSDGSYKFKCINNTLRNMITAEYEHKFDGKETRQNEFSSSIKWFGLAAMIIGLNLASESQETRPKGIELPRRKVPTQFGACEMNKAFNQSYMSFNQEEIIEYLCYTEQSVSISQHTEIIKGRIVQYVTLFPRDWDRPFHQLFFIPEGSTEVIKIEWAFITKITWEENAVINPPKAINTIKRSVANALTLPQSSTSMSYLIKETREKKVDFDEIYATLYDDSRTVLQCRLIAELIRRGEMEEVRKQYNAMVLNKTTAFSSMELFDFCFAILSLVKAGVITEPLKPEMHQRPSRTDPDGTLITYAPDMSEVDYERGIGFAIRESQPRNLSLLLEYGVISQEDVKRIQQLRQDPIIQQLCLKLNFQEHFDLT